jgi:hypothetical protein
MARPGHDKGMKRKAYGDVNRDLRRDGAAPAEVLDEPGAERPADGAGEAAPQSQGSDRAPGMLAVQAAQRGKPSIVETDPMPTPMTNQAIR